MESSSTRKLANAVDSQWLTPADISTALNCASQRWPANILDRLGCGNLTYHPASREELEEYVLWVLKLIDSPRIQRSTEENHAVWEKGWQENLDLLRSGVPPAEALKPKYFRGSKFLRFNRGLIVTGNEHLEHDLFKLQRYCLFTRFLSECESICELGCGSCQNLLMLSDLFPNTTLVGLDWTQSSVGIMANLASVHGRKIQGHRFDMMRPDPTLKLPPGSAIITIHALEQIGTGHDQLIQFLTAARPRLVLHLEPILEFYEDHNLLDYLALRYSNKRNYLSGFAAALKEQERQNAIEILEWHRPGIGGVIHEASVIAWRPR